MKKEEARQKTGQQDLSFRVGAAAAAVVMPPRQINACVASAKLNPRVVAQVPRKKG